MITSVTIHEKVDPSATFYVQVPNSLFKEISLDMKLETAKINANTILESLMASKSKDSTLVSIRLVQKEDDDAKSCVTFFCLPNIILKALQSSGIRRCFIFTSHQHLKDVKVKSSWDEPIHKSILLDI
jgi:acetoacetate decarboxylase